MSFLEHLYHFALPLIFSNVLHMWIVKKNLWAALNRPVSQRLFGANKGTRAFFILPLATALGALALQMEEPQEALARGFGLGLVYLLSELPNSFIKRTLGIPPGQHSERYPILQALSDKSDSLIGTILFYTYMVEGSLLLAVQLFLIGLAIHSSLSFLLWKGGLKSNF